MLTDDFSPAPRVTDAQRQQATTALAAAYTRGALDPTEYDARTTRVLQARDTTELAALTADLPAPEPGELTAERRDRDLKDWLAEWRYWLGGAVIMSAIWGAQAIRSEPGFFWPLVPLAVWAAILIAVAIWPSEDDDK